MTESSKPNVAGLLLAAGGSSRLGRPKQLVGYEGKSLIRRAAEALIDAGCSPVVALLGAEVERSTLELDGLAAEVVVNGAWELGMGSSIACGVGWIVDNASPEAILITLCDQPLVTPSHLRQFVDEFSKTRVDVIAAHYNEIPGVPALFSANLFHSLSALKGDKGAREIIRNSPDALTIPLPVAAIDVDRNEDFFSLLRDRSGDQ